MRLFPSTFAIALGLAAPALAGGPTVLPDDPAPTALPTAAAHDWSGPYAGISYGNSGGEVEFLGNSTVDLRSGRVFGAHVGFLVQRGTFVYGGELAYGNVSLDNVDPFEAVVTKTLDLKARLGYAADRLLVYGVVGYSQSDLHVGATLWDMTGPSFGLGAEYAVSDRLRLGLEYLSHDVEGVNDSGLPLPAIGKFETLSLRLTFAF